MVATPVYGEQRQKAMVQGQVDTEILMEKEQTIV
jgi:hypothetical protein